MDFRQKIDNSSYKKMKEEEDNKRQLSKVVWDSKKIEKCLYDIENGIEDYRPFKDKNINRKAPNILYDFSIEEMEEIKKCSKDIIYFADKYCYAMTDFGVKKIDLRGYQKNLLKHYQDNRFGAVCASRQCGKTVTSAIFLTWYLCFNIDRNAVIVANKAITMKEIIDKLKVVMDHIPYFMKPGIVVDNVESLKFDNGCRLNGFATSKTPALGFTVHLLYADEFAHIPANIVEPFYKSIYPTLSSSNISRIIITSTPNGLNKFYEIYNGAITGQNEYKAFRVDWWEVPGHDEEWKHKETLNLGSEEAFNQEYGNQFLMSSQLLLSGENLSYLSRIKRKYEWHEIQEFHKKDYNYENFRWDPDFNMELLKKGNLYHFVISIDIASGVGKDYTIVNVFMIEHRSEAKIKTYKNPQGDYDFFRLRQIGLYRSNQEDLDNVYKLVESLVFDVIGEDYCTIVLETNYRGDYFLLKMAQHEKYYDELFYHSLHGMQQNEKKQGIKLTKENKPIYAQALKRLIDSKTIILTEYETFNEFTTFGIYDGRYASQTGHDDIAMSCVILTSFIDSDHFFDCISRILDEQDDRVKTTIQKKLFGSSIENVSFESIYDMINDDSISYVEEYSEKDYDKTEDDLNSWW